MQLTLNTDALSAGDLALLELIVANHRGATAAAPEARAEGPTEPEPEAPKPTRRRAKRTVETMAENGSEKAAEVAFPKSDPGPAVPVEPSEEPQPAEDPAPLQHEVTNVKSDEPTAELVSAAMKVGERLLGQARIPELQAYLKEQGVSRVRELASASKLQAFIDAFPEN